MVVTIRILNGRECSREAVEGIRDPDVGLNLDWSVGKVEDEKEGSRREVWFDWGTSWILGWKPNLALSKKGVWWDWSEVAGGERRGVRVVPCLLRSEFKVEMFSQWIWGVGHVPSGECRFPGWWYESGLNSISWPICLLWIQVIHSGRNVSEYCWSCGFRLLRSLSVEDSYWERSLWMQHILLGNEGLWVWENLS